MVEQYQLKKTKWDYLFYLSMAILTIWFILKATGVINTPFWLEYGIPLGSLMLGFLTIYHTITDKFLSLSANDARMEEHLKHIDKDLEVVKKDVEFLKRAVKA
jgi:hypothetical protein